MRPPLCFLIPFLGVLFLFGLLAFVGGLVEARSARRAGRWPTAPAAVTRVAVVEDDGCFRVEVAYTFAVDGVEYTGSRLAFGYGGSSERAEHDEIFEKLRGAKTVAARYDPSNPAESCLSNGVNNYIWILVIVGALVTALAIGLTAFFSTTGRWVLVNNLVAE